MPYMKVNLNGRKYVISGLTERTSSKHILCSLARVDSTFHLETSDLSDTSLDVEERNKGVRSSRSRARHTRVHSSTSSLEITEWKNYSRGALSEKSCLKHVCVMNNNTKSQKWDAEKTREKDGKCSRKELKPKLESRSEVHKKIQETSSEDQMVKRNGKGNEKEKVEVKRRKRKAKKRPASQDVGSWKYKYESKENEEKMKFGKKGWKSADDVRGKKCSHSSSCEKMDGKMERNRVSERSRKSKYCHKSDELHNDEYIAVDAIDKPSECHRVHRHVRKELNKIRIQKLVSRAVDERLVDFHVAVLQSSQRIHPERQQQNEEETKRKLIQLIDSQRKCLNALTKADKQTKKALNRYKRYSELDNEKIQFYNASLDREKILSEARKRRNSDTEHDTGISEQHSDSSTENKQTGIYDAYKYDVISYVVSDDVIKGEDPMENKESVSVEDNKTADSVLMEKRESKTASTKDTKSCGCIVETDSKTDNDVMIGECVTSNDVIGKESKTRDIMSNGIKTRNKLVNDVMTKDVAKMDANVSDDIMNDVKVIDVDKDIESDQDVIIAKQTEIIPFDQSETSSTAIPCCSADSVTASTMSEVSDYCSHSNSMDSHPSDIQGCREVLMQEKARESELKQKIDRFSGETRLMDQRILEQNKMADVLESLENLNIGLVRDNRETERDKHSSLRNEKKNLRKSIQLSRNLYEYQKGEINDNAVNLQIIESQIKRKRWHVESAIRHLGQFVTSSLRTQLERIQSLEDVTGITTSVVFKPQLNGTFV